MPREQLPVQTPHVVSEVIPPTLGRAPAPWIQGLALAVCVLIWGTTWAAIRVGLDDVPPFTGVALRFALAAAVLAVLAVGMRVRLVGGPVERKLWLVHGIFTFTLSYTVTYWSEQFVPSGLASVLFATFPLFVALLAHRFLPGERLGGMALLGVIVGFSGVAVIFSEDFTSLGGRQVLVGSLVMLISPIAAAIGNVAIKRWGSGMHPLSLNVGGMTFTAVLVGGLAALVERDRAVVLSTPAVASILYLAIFGSAVTFSLYFWLLRHMTATRLSLIAYVIPVVAVAVGTTLLDEPLTARIVAGAVLVLVGVGLASRK